jgi:hypothetical protein
MVKYFTPDVSWGISGIIYGLPGLMCPVKFPIGIISVSENENSGVIRTRDAPRTPRSHHPVPGPHISG